MEENSFEDEKFEFAAGFRFRPTDKELINHYLTKKVADSSFTATAIAEVDINKSEPWDLPRLAKMGEIEWYFFSLRDKNYPIGQNITTDAGYWKAMGRDKQIIKEHALIGMKKTLVFYKGGAPRGEKTNWVMHEYRLEDKKYNLLKTERSEWVICKVYKKGNCERKVQNNGSAMQSQKAEFSLGYDFNDAVDIFSMVNNNDMS